MCAMPRCAALLVPVVLLAGCGGGAPGEIDRFLHAGGHFTLRGTARMQADGLLQLVRETPSFPVRVDGDLSPTRLSGEAESLVVSTQFTAAGRRLRRVRDLLRHASWSDVGARTAHLELDLTRGEVEDLGQPVPRLIEGFHLSAKVTYRPGVNR
jgi:hypothetical protein